MNNFLLALSYPSIRFYSDFISLHPNGIILTHNIEIMRLCESKGIKYEMIPAPKISNNKLLRILLKPFIYRYKIKNQIKYLSKKYGNNNNIYITVLGMNDYLLPIVLRSRNNILYCNDSLNHVSHYAVKYNVLDYLYIFYLFFTCGIFYNLYTDGTVKKFFWLKNHNYLEINPFSYNYDFFIKSKKKTGNILFIGGYDSSIIHEKANWEKFKKLILALKKDFFNYKICYKPHPNYTKDELFNLFADLTIIDSFYPVEIIQSEFDILLTFITTSVVDKENLISVARIIDSDAQTIEINSHYNINMPNTYDDLIDILNKKISL
jgi:hypothetical protein